MGFEEFSRYSNNVYNKEGFTSKDDFGNDTMDGCGNNKDDMMMTDRQTYLHNMVMDVGECGFKCIKITFFVFNLLFWIVGFVVLLLAAILHTTRNEATTDYTHWSGLQGYLNGPVILLVVGSFTLLLSFMACIGSRKNNILLLTSYTIILLLVTSIELGLVITAYSYRVQIENSLLVDFQKTLNQYSLSGNEGITSALDSLQQEFRCCGNKGYKDWSDTKWWSQHGGNYSVPTSCCVIPRMRNCNRDIGKKLEMVFTEGCYTHIKNYLFENIHIISGFAIWILVLEVLGIVFSIVLILKIRKQNKQNSYLDNRGDSFNAGLDY